MPTPLGSFAQVGAVTRTIADSTVADITKMLPPSVSTFLVTNERTADAIAAHVRRRRNKSCLRYSIAGDVCKPSIEYVAAQAGVAPRRQAVAGSGRGFDRRPCSVLRRRREGRPENSAAPPAGRTKGAFPGAARRRTHPTTVQILSPIDPAESSRLAELEPHLRRVQVVHVESRAALEMIPVYGPYVHAFLLDSGRPNAATPELGGTGRPDDWAVSAEFVEASQLPVFLGGGLSPSNVADAIRQVRPFGVDLCSGVLTDGRLDPGKLEAFFLAARGADEGRISA